jgi:hypothetical protein
MARALSYCPAANVRGIRRVEGRGWRALLVALACVFAAASGCKNSDYCCSSEEGCALAKADGFGDGSRTPCTDPERPFCDDFGLYGAQNACIAEPSQIKCTGDQQCVDSTRPYCVEEACRECRDASSCDAEAPVCTPAYECGGCQTEADCAPFAGTTPHCGDEGTCVACRGNEDCSGATPVCTGAPAACTACTSDIQCDSGVCVEDTGACRTEDTILYVAPAGSDVRTCSRQAPCQTLNRALSFVTATKNLVLVSPGDYITQPGQATVIEIATPVTIEATGASLTRSDDGAVVEVRGATTRATIVGARIHGASGVVGDGVQCANGATLVLRLTTLDGNARTGVRSDSCTLTVERSTIGGGTPSAGNLGGGLSTVSGMVTIRNNVLVGNGKENPGGTTFGGASVATPAAGSTFEFNTITQNKAAITLGGGLRCETTDAMRIANNIVFANTKPPGLSQVTNLGCTLDFNLSEDTLGGTNVVGTPIFENGFHLAASSDGVDDADPAATLNIDFDGDVRPQPTGGRRDIGADEVRR